MAWFEEGSPFKKEIRDNFANTASTVLDDAILELDAGPPARLELTDRHPAMPLGMTEEVDIQSINAMKRAAGEEDPIYANEAGMRNREEAMYRGEGLGEVAAARDAGELLGSTLGRARDPLTSASFPRTESFLPSGQAPFLGSEEQFVEMGDQFGGTTMGVAPQNISAAETWEPWSPQTAYDKRRMAQEQYAKDVSDRHPEMVRGEAGSAVAAAPSERNPLQQLVDSVADLVEKMKGYSLSPEEFSEIVNMPPEQLTEVYNNLARQQGRPLHPSPHAWNLMGREPFQSPESAAIFQGRVPMSEEVIRPGESEYSQWNIPFRATGPGFMAQDYAQAQPGTTDWMRQIYPWARNLPENILERAIQDGDYLRMLMEKAEAGELLPLM